MTVNSLGACILAGGEGKRMGGQEKSQLLLKSQTFFSLLVERLKGEFDQIYISANRPDLFKDYSYSVIGDLYPRCGPLGGLASVLKSVSEEGVFFVACDMPLLRIELIRLMKNQWSSQWEAFVPKDREGRWIPTCSIYSKRILPFILENIAQKNYRVHSLFSQIKIKALEPSQWEGVDPEGHSFLNINTPAEYEELKSHARKIDSPFGI